MDVSLVVPIYNARSVVERSVQDMVRIMDATGKDYEVLLRDDASEDGGQDLLRGISSRHARVRCFYNASNQGLGATLRALFRDAQGEHVIYCDCDLPFGADILPAFLNNLAEWDIVVASRYAGSRSDINVHRWAFSRLYYWMCKILFNVPVADLGSGTVAMRKDSLQKLSLRSSGFDIHAELFVQAARCGLAVREIPAKAVNPKHSTFSVLRHGPAVIGGTLQIFWRRWKGATRDRERQDVQEKNVVKKPVRGNQPAV